LGVAVRRRGFPARERKNLAWHGSLTGVPVIVVTSGLVSLELVNNATLNAKGQGTIMRTRGHIYMEPTLTGTDPVVSWGLAVVDERARLGGVASVPLATNLEDLFAFGVMSAGELGATVDHGPVGQRVDVDSKAMRRFDLTDSIILVLQGAGSGHSAEVYFHFDMLIKED